MGENCFFCENGPGGEPWAYTSRDNEHVCQTCFDKRCKSMVKPQTLPQSSQKCENCRFFDVGLPGAQIAKLKAEYMADPNYPNNEWWIGGECHESSPYVYRDKRERIRSKFPEARSDKWCGKWQQKDDTADVIESDEVVREIDHSKGGSK